MQAVQREFDLTQAPVEALTSMLQAYRKRADEPILAWAKRAQVARRQIIDAFLNAGGILWGEESARSGRPRMLFAELHAAIGSDRWTPGHPLPEFLPVLRWIEDVDMRRNLGLENAE